MNLSTKFMNHGRAAALYGGGGTPGFALGTQALTNAAEILYHKLQVSISSGLDFSYTYLEGSGIYTNGTIDDFLGELEDTGAPYISSLLYNMANDAPNIVVKRSCFVVIELHGLPNLRFQSSHRAIDTVQDYHAEYCSLVHIDTSWAESPVTSSSTEPCWLAYFGVDSPQSNRDDGYNLYFQFDQSSNQTIYAQVDPMIKNKGGLSTHGHRSLRKREENGRDSELPR